MSDEPKSENDYVRFPTIGRIPQKLLDDVQKDATERGFDNTSAYVIQAVKHFLVCKENEAMNAMKPIFTKYAGKCLLTGHEVPANTWVMYGKGVGIVCMDHFIERFGDKALVAKYLKNRELERIHDALTKECSRVAGDVERFRVLDKMVDLQNQQEETVRLIKDFLTHNVGTDEERKALEDVLRNITDGKKIMYDMDQFIKTLIRSRKWRRQIYRQDYTENEETDQSSESPPQ
jgi:hypothetical protein